jgi:hypothetical protein
VDPESKLGISGSQPTLIQVFASSSWIVECEVHRDTPHEEHQGWSYSPNSTTHTHLSPDCNNDTDTFEFDITLDGISLLKELSTGYPIWVALFNVLEGIVEFLVMVITLMIWIKQPMIT